MIPAAVLLLAIAGLAAALALMIATIGAVRVGRTIVVRRRNRLIAELRPRVAAVVAEALDSVEGGGGPGTTADAEAGTPAGAAGAVNAVNAVSAVGAGGAANGPGGPGGEAAGLRHRHRATPKHARRRVPPEVAAPGAEQLIDLAASLPRRQRGLLDDIVLGYLNTIRGPAREPLLYLLGRNGTVPRARRRLHRPGLVGRAHAAEILGRAGGPEVALDLVRLLRDRHPEVRVVAAAGLAGAPPTREVVHALLSTVDGDRRVPAGLVVDTLLRLGQEATPALAEALAHATPNVRAVAAETLGLLETTQATQALLDALHDPHSTVEVQVRAAGAAGRIGDPAAFEPLVACLAPDRAPALRVAAVQALGLLGSPRAVPHLVPVLSAAHQLASSAAASLAMLGQPGAAALRDVAAREPETLAGRQAAAALASLELTISAPAAVVTGAPRPATGSMALAESRVETTDAAARTSVS